LPNTKQLKEFFSKISQIYFKDLKTKQLESKERRDLFKIREEIEDVKIALDKKIKHNHINVGV
jgi:hypothetical protein